MSIQVIPEEWRSKGDPNCQGQVILLPRKDGRNDVTCNGCSLDYTTALYREEA